MVSIYKMSLNSQVRGEGGSGGGHEQSRGAESQHGGAHSGALQTQQHCQVF